MKKFMIILAAMLIMTGCSKENQNTADNAGDTGNNTAMGDSGTSAAEATSDTTADTTAQGEQAGDFSFVYNDVTIHMNTEAAPVIEALGDPVSYFEAASCAFQGLDKIYTYNSFELDTYPNNGVDYISAIDLKDDTVSTDEGVSIGSALEDVIAAYGEDYSEESGAYTYIKGDSKITFIIENNSVSAITYLANVEGLQ